MGKKKQHKSYGHKSGLPPGSLVHTGDFSAPTTPITAFHFGPDFFEESISENISDVKQFLDKPGLAWLNFDSVHDTKFMNEIGQIFGLHSLVLEDIMNTHQRPKAEEQGHVLFLVAVILRADELKSEFIEEQISFVLGKNFLLTFQEYQGDVFEPIRDRLRNKIGRIRERDVDYLLYALLDVIVDSYFVLLEDLAEKMDEMEDRIFTKPDNRSLIEIQENKRKLISLRRAVIPLRDAVDRAEHLEFELIRPETGPFLQDLSDHLHRTAELIESYRDVNNGLKDSYMSGMSLKLNHIMRVLTIISTIFIPLTFIVGVYGMNFNNMPELEWHYGYSAVWVFMVLLSLGLLWYFKKKKWL